MVLFCSSLPSSLLRPSVCQSKRTTFKLDLYRKFTNALALSVLVSVAWIAYEVSRGLIIMLVQPMSMCPGSDPGYSRGGL